MTGVLGAIVLAVIIVVVLPMSFLMGGAVVSVLLGSSHKATAEADHAGSELIDLNV